MVFRALLFFIFAFPAFAAAPLDGAWNILVTDLLTKYAASHEIQSLCNSIPDCQQTLQNWDYGIRAQAKISQIIDYLIRTQNPKLPDLDRAQKVKEIVTWFREKYGVLDLPVFTPLHPGADGSYRTPGKIRFFFAAPKLPGSFDAHAASSIQDLQSYISRKWGGLDRIASPERIVFSELGMSDTLKALNAQGFNEFDLVNAPYATRGSKILLAHSTQREQPLIVFFSFVSRDLLQHKLMQLAFQFGEKFQAVRLLTSNNLKSWEVADLVVNKALATLSPMPIDDLVLGYADHIVKNLAKRGKFLQSSRIGDFATIQYFRISGKSGLERTVAVLTDVELRYFGRSILTLLKPFLKKNVDRVIFAGSAGSIDPSLPLHALVLPRSFHELSDDGTKVKAVGAIDNELFGLLPMGESYAGKHISVPSPLVESQAMVKALREREGILTVDVEGAQIAQMIANHNTQHGTKIRFAAAFVVTDTPVAVGDVAKTGYGLHKPDFSGKKQAKEKYVSALNLLWELPDRFAPSNHTKIVTEHFAELIRTHVRDGNTVSLAVLYAEIERRLQVLLAHSASDLRVSHGLIRSYRDLLRNLDQAGITPLRPEYHDHPTSVSIPHALPIEYQRILLLQSLGRSSTLNSGRVTFETGISGADVRVRALFGASAAVEFILSKVNAPLTSLDVQELHQLLNAGVLKDEQLGSIRKYDYRPLGGGVVSSAAAFEEFTQWLSNVTPSPEAALEAFVRFEHLHPFSDGNGRVAELLLQHTMLRASGHPLVIPNRFDIEYILTLARNGSFPAPNSSYLEKVIEDSVAFSTWLSKQIAVTQVKRVFLHKKTGLVSVSTSSGTTYSIKSLFRADQRIKLERESREFVQPGDALPNSSLVLERTNYDAIYSVDPCFKALTRVRANAP